MPNMPDLNDDDTQTFNDRWNAIVHNYLEPPLLNDVNAKLAFEPDDLAPYEKTKTEALAMVWDALPPQADKVAAMTRAHVALAQSYMKHGLTQDMQAAALKAARDPVPQLTDLERELLAALKSLIGRYDPECPGAAMEPDAGCIECTVGTVPNDRNTGLCPMHHAFNAIAKAEGKPCP